MLLTFYALFFGHFGMLFFGYKFSSIDFTFIFQLFHTNFNRFSNDFHAFEEVVFSPKLVRSSLKTSSFKTSSLITSSLITQHFLIHYLQFRKLHQKRFLSRSREIDAYFFIAAFAFKIEYFAFAEFFVFYHVSNFQHLVFLEVVV